MQSYALMLQADEDDQFLTESILLEMQQKIHMQFISTVKQMDLAIAEWGPPTVILVNNNNHRHSAISLLRLLKADPQLDHIPIVVLGEITTPEYIRQFYRAGANSYIIKPSNIDTAKKKIGTFLDYWFTVAEV